MSRTSPSGTRLFVVFVIVAAVVAMWLLAVVYLDVLLDVWLDVWPFDACAADADPVMVPPEGQVYAVLLERDAVLLLCDAHPRTVLSGQSSGGLEEAPLNGGVRTINL